MSTATTPDPAALIRDSDVAAWEARNGFPLSEIERRDLRKASAVDVAEGVEWLPWYKAALNMLAQLNGYICGATWGGRTPTPEDVAVMNRLWTVHLMFAGLGPDVLPPEELAKRKAAIARMSETLFDGPGDVGGGA